MKSFGSCFASGFDHVGSLELRYNNQSAICLSKNPVFHNKTKHVKIDVHFIREKVGGGILALVYVRTTN